MNNVTRTRYISSTGAFMLDLLAETANSCWLPTVDICQHYKFYVLPTARNVNDNRVAVHMTHNSIEHYRQPAWWTHGVYRVVRKSLPL